MTQLIVTPNLREKAWGYEKDDKDKGNGWSESMYNINSQESEPNGIIGKTTTTTTKTKCRICLERINVK